MPDDDLCVRLREGAHLPITGIDGDRGMLHIVGKGANAVHRKVWRRRWVVDGKYAGRGVEALGYLARYVFRVAIVNSRIERFDGSCVTFRYRESKTQATRRCTLTASDFLARFLQHVLPKRFVKVRYYGLFAAAAHRDFGRARELLDARDAKAENPDDVTGSTETNEPDVDDDPECPHCRLGRLRIVAILERTRGPP